MFSERAILKVCFGGSNFEIVFSERVVLITNFLKKYFKESNFENVFFEEAISKKDFLRLQF